MALPAGLPSGSVVALAAAAGPASSMMPSSAPPTVAASRRRVTGSAYDASSDDRDVERVGAEGDANVDPEQHERLEAATGHESAEVEDVARRQPERLEQRDRLILRRGVVTGHEHAVRPRD